MLVLLGKGCPQSVLPPLHLQPKYCCSQMNGWWMMKLFPAHHRGVESGNIHIFPRKVEKFFQCLQLYVMRLILFLTQM